MIGEAADGAAALVKIGQQDPIWFFSTCRCRPWAALEVVRQLKHGKRLAGDRRGDRPRRTCSTGLRGGRHRLSASTPVRQERLSEAVERAKRLTGRQATETDRAASGDS